MLLFAFNVVGIIISCIATIFTVQMGMWQFILNLIILIILILPACIKKINGKESLFFHLWNDSF